MEEYSWHIVHEEQDSVYGNKQAAESMRYLFCKATYDRAETSVASSTNYNEKLSDMYTMLMNPSLSDDTGINNYAGAILPLIANERNESDSWAYTLDFSLSSSQMHLISPDSQNSPEANSSHSKIIIPETDTSCHGISDGKSQANSNSGSLPQLPLYRQTSNLVPKCSTSHLLTRPLREEEPCHVQPVTAAIVDGSAQLGQLPDSFRTAREQLVINNAIRNKQQVPSHSTAGAGKRSLGPRRGGGGKFVSPLAQEANQDGISNLVTDVTRQACGGKSFEGENSGDNLELPKELAHLDPKIVELIMNEIMDSNTTMTWDDIAGLEFAKKTIKEVIVLPMLRPDIFTGLRGPPKGLLLFGPPGTGKTLIGKCVASQSKCTFFSISASSLTSKWVGEGEKMVRTLFEVARFKQPSVVFIDEIDSLLTQRSESEHESSRRIKTEFLVQMDGVGCNSEDRVLIIGATNRPQELDEAARRRFVKRLYIPLPDVRARAAIIHHLMSKQEVTLDDNDLENIVTETSGYSGADMANLCKEAALGPVRDIKFEDIETVTLDQVRPINGGDFSKAVRQVRASVDISDLDSYLDWNSKFGSWDIQNL